MQCSISRASSCAFSSAARGLREAIRACRDLRLRALDAAHRVWQADGNENTAIQLHALQRCSRPTAESGTSLQRLAQWALDSQPLVQSMQAVVQQLIAA